MGADDGQVRKIGGYVIDVGDGTGERKTKTSPSGHPGPRTGGSRVEQHRYFKLHTLFIKGIEAPVVGVKGLQGLLEFDADQP